MKTNIILSILLLITTLDINAASNIKSKFVNTKYATTTHISTQAQYLNISPQEVQRAQLLRQRYKGFISDDITSVEVLGIFAKTAKERTRYAEIFAKAFRESVAKTLEFQKAYQQANLRLFGNGSMFDYKIKPRPRASNRVSYTFDLKSCDESCNNSLTKLIANSTNKPLDLYFENATAQEIRQWATDNNIAHSAVYSKQITLNFNK